MINNIHLSSNNTLYVSGSSSSGGIHLFDVAAQRQLQLLSIGSSDVGSVCGLCTAKDYKPLYFTDMMYMVLKAQKHICVRGEYLG